MRPSSLGNTLRAIVLSTPFVQAIALPGCCLEVTSGFVEDGGGEPPPLVSNCPDAGETVGPLPAGFVSNGGPLPCNDICPPDTSGFPGGGCGARDCVLCTNDGTPSVACDYICEGRRPGRLLSETCRDSVAPLAHLWRQIARLEAASVIAFRDLECDLRAHGAPSALIEAARRAARDEIGHARVTAAICRSYGAKPVRPAVMASRTPRSLEAVALENAVEGCVRETFGAVVSLWQAQHAGDATTRRAMAPIAADELRHAELAWSVAAWAEPQLDARGRRRVRAAQRAAFAELLRSTEKPVPTELVTVAGLPHPSAALQLARQMGEALALA